MSNKSYIGTIRNTRMHYYDSKINEVKFKARPVLVLGVENDTGITDLTVVPVSKISDSRRIIASNDIKVEKTEYPLCNLKEQVSYIRTSKISTVQSKDTARSEICDLKGTYPDLYERVREKVKEFVNDL